LAVPGHIHVRKEVKTAIVGARCRFERSCGFQGSEENVLRGDDHGRLHALLETQMQVAHCLFGNILQGGRSKTD
jgi:hypothetical protein